MGMGNAWFGLPPFHLGLKTDSVDKLSPLVLYIYVVILWVIDFAYCFNLPENISVKYKKLLKTVFLKKFKRCIKCSTKE